MLGGVRSLETILGEARTKGEPLEALFGVPVLILVSEDSDFEPVSAVTDAGPAVSPIAGNSQTILVVALQSRHAMNRGQPQLSFGRSEVCDVIIPIASVSKHHGYFAEVGAAWLVSDVGSTNGTSVAGSAVSKTGTELIDGCSLRIGRVTAQFLTAKSFCELLRKRLLGP